MMSGNNCMTPHRLSMLTLGKRTFHHRAGIALVASLASVAPAAAQAPAGAPAPTPATAAAPGELTLSPRDQPIGAFLRDLFGRVGRPVVPSPSLTGTVNGVFRGSVNKIFSDVARAFNLVSYDDGAALYVYGANDVSVQTLNVGPAVAARVVRQVAAQRLADRRNYARASADGTLVVSGTPRFVQQVQQMAQGGTATAARGNLPLGSPLAGPAFGAPPPVQPLEFRVFYLKYARAEDTVSTAGGRELRLPGLATILQNLVLNQRPGGSALSGGAPTLGARLVRQSQPRLKGLGLGGVMPNAAQTPANGLPVPGLYPTDNGDVLGYGGFGSTGGGLGGDMVAPLTQDIVRIEPNPYLNAVIVRDVPERMAAYDSLIRALDVEPQVVEVEATIIDINTDKLRRLGVNWRLGSGGFGFLFGDGTSNDTLLNRNPALSRRDNTTAITPQGQGGTISTIIGSQREFLGRIQALETKGVARVVSRPQVLTLSNVEAIFDRTRTFYVRVAGREEVDLFNVTAGTVLRVNPHVFRDQDQTRIRMLVNIEDGSISRDSLVENIPIVERASVSTQAMVLDGESLLLGGMTVDADADSSYKIPLLGDIPLLGNLFKVQQRSRSRTERLFLLTPRLVSLGSRVGPTTVATTTRVAPAPVNPPINPKPGFSTDGSIMR
ncbi:MAG: EscC/YscC/HrcC family type III secretion system outer membrane ring protein [Sphingomonas sp.]|uniref:Type 3 secretion system secretin n=3 Tax=Sphingomonadaceae TaxID=41297 RepID=A0A2A4I4V7_9SPHN|nr:EscC/YscC/HrcC family type III secretion system outer membrane ring protein [Sphingomonas adhaesiva]PZU82058.1 MAG: EscC/YscC/HrcC family type III secretion system outer membrane ring protein [Sphingomonas sp.]